MSNDKVAVRVRAAVLASLLCAPAIAADLSVTVADMQGLSVPDAAVYLLPLQGKAPRGSQKGSIEQMDKTFIPYVSVVQAGTAVSFPNKDTVRHHVYSFSAPKVFDLKLYSGTPSQPVVFDKPGLVALGCNIHDWMLAYVLVVETPWFAVSKDRGNAVVENVPAGDYNMLIWHPRMKEEMMQQIKVGAAAQAVRVRVTLSKPDLRRQGG
ncbi:methylamine utilization protein [Vogesella sp. XCS3]|uniref:methylamine utilization protein n=1 Tax=Vogesella sp. XCS3 TaxID=2877939 RepID=UPI001B741C6B|nr:methylamine utilization protein [Vogesella sp. XCS3]MBP7581638.1 methylamine utilization protein [Vogesella sp.]UDM17539.1 methylamine utilization protein [Vogesella sp. XCS3]